MLLAVLVLALAVAGMHHVTHAGAHSGGHTVAVAVENDHEAPEPTTLHDFLHLCLAVLGAGLFLLATAVLRLRRTATRAPGAPRRTRALGGRDGPAPLSGRQLLASTCVLRL
ncbi:hypothetical protein A4R43_02920 [Amycolatopsis albispora]|uniref:Uncharacterized protein n=2 Tax=Amycolatopsis albispora TaxID=1804986 RepID=A0A344L0M9_9PSEU|nr:hypothetical protein A4R43_02920 [Amycolatopsis albispora]